MRESSCHVWLGPSRHGSPSSREGADTARPMQTQEAHRRLLPCEGEARTLPRIQIKDVVTMAKMVPVGMDFWASLRSPERLDPAMMPVEAETGGADVTDSPGETR